MLALNGIRDLQEFTFRSLFNWKWPQFTEIFRRFLTQTKRCVACMKARVWFESGHASKSSHECTRKNKMRINFFFFSHILYSPKHIELNLILGCTGGRNSNREKKTNRVSRVCKTFRTSFLLFALSLLSVLYLYETSISITSV